MKKKWWINIWGVGGEEHASNGGFAGGFGGRRTEGNRVMVIVAEREGTEDAYFPLCVIDRAISKRFLDLVTG